MSSGISFSGLGSGLPTSDWVAAIIQSESTRLTSYKTQKSETQSAKTTLNTIESKFTSLRSALEKLTDSKLASTMDLFQRRTAASSDDTIATASASNSAVIQQIKLEVDNLATSTVAKSTTSIGKNIEGTDVFTSLSNAKLDKTDSDATTGTFSLFVNGEKHDITINSTDTLNNIIDTINNDAELDGIEAGIDANGNFQIKVDEAVVTSGFSLGSSSDTSNFLNVMNLSTAGRTALTGDPIYDAVYQSVNPVSKVNVSGTILDGDANLSGTFTEESYSFKIGDADFNVGSSTTFSDLISAINRDEDAGVIASYNAKENKLVLTSKEQGATAIGLEDTSGDFLEQLGLISASGDSLASQKLGKNAMVHINDSEEAIEVNSNTITADMSGLAGVTINLKNVTEVGEPLTIDVSQDTDELKSAVSGFVEKFNAVISSIDSETKSGQELYGEYSLISLRNSLRTMSTDMVSGLSTYNSLSSIGITTGSVGTSVDTSTTSLKLDEKKFMEALIENPSEVKALLIGDKSLGVTGIFEKLETKVENALDPANGYFAARESSMNSSISSIDKAITREQERLDKRENSLTQQFNRMDQYISQMKSQSSALSSL